MTMSCQCNFDSIIGEVTSLCGLHGEYMQRRAKEYRDHFDRETLLLRTTNAALMTHIERMGHPMIFVVDSCDRIVL